MLTQQNILAVLSKIIDPDFNRDIVSLGFVKNIKIEEKNVSFDIELTTPACPIKAEFQQKAEDAIKGLGGVDRVLVNMTSQAKPKPSMPNTPSALSQVKSIIAVSSCKGGVGKSTIAGCLAMELAGRGFKVGLLDADIYGPSIPTLFNLRNISIHANEKQQLIPIERNHLKIMSFGFFLGDSPAVLRGPIVSRYIQQLLHTTAWGELDYLFIDMPPGTGDVQLTITQSLQLSGAVIVTTPQSLSLVDVSRGILMFEKVDVPMLGIIENMSYFLCDGCQKKHSLFGEGGKLLEERFGLPILAQFPLLKELSGKLEKPIQNDFLKNAVDAVIRALGKSSLTKKEIPQISFNEKETRLRWLDGKEIIVSNRDLRLSCRCALCVNELTGEQILRTENIKPDIQPKEITPLGNYAVGITWNDGHSSGIYPYKSICEITRTSLS